jgi:hypothetical protein
VIGLIIQQLCQRLQDFLAGRLERVRCALLNNGIDLFCKHKHEQNMRHRHTIPQEKGIGNRLTSTHRCTDTRTSKSQHKRSTDTRPDILPNLILSGPVNELPGVLNIWVISFIVPFFVNIDAMVSNCCW